MNLLNLTSSASATVSPILPPLAQTTNPLAIVFGLIAITAITVLVIYMLKRMKTAATAVF